MRPFRSGKYNLKGTEILEKYLSKKAYDRELFRHPPLYPTLLIPFVIADANYLAVTVSWLGHLLCIVAIAMIGRRFFQNFQDEINSLVFWIPVLGITVDPTLIFISRKLWIDSLLTGLIAMAVAFYIEAGYSAKRKSMLIIAGTFLGLATIAKVSALAVAPVIACILYFAGDTHRTRLKNCLWGGMPVVIIALPWFIRFYVEYGVLFAHWAKPDQWAIDHSAYVHKVVNQPFYYYVKGINLLQPLVIVCTAICIIRPRFFKNANFIIPLVYFMTYLVVFTWLGINRYSYLMRHIAPIFPSIYIMLYAIISEKEGKNTTFLVLCLLCIVYAGITGGIYLLAPKYDEILNILELCGILKWGS